MLNRIKLSKLSKEDLLKMKTFVDNCLLNFKLVN